MTDIQRDLGRLESRIDAIESRLIRMESKMDGVHDTLVQARGGWRTLLLVAGLAGAIGASASKLAAAIAALR